MSLTSRHLTSSLSPTLNDSGDTVRSTSSSEVCTRPVLPGRSSTSSPNFSTLSTLQFLHSSGTWLIQGAERPTAWDQQHQQAHITPHWRVASLPHVRVPLQAMQGSCIASDGPRVPFCSPVDFPNLWTGYGGADHLQRLCQTLIGWRPHLHSPCGTIHHLRVAPA